MPFNKSMHNSIYVLSSPFYLPPPSRKINTLEEIRIRLLENFQNDLQMQSILNNGGLIDIQTEDQNPSLFLVPLSALLDRLLEDIPELEHSEFTRKLTEQALALSQINSHLANNQQVQEKHRKLSYRLLDSNFHFLIKSNLINPEDLLNNSLANLVLTDEALNQFLNFIFSNAESSTFSSKTIVDLIDFLQEEAMPETIKNKSKMIPYFLDQRFNQLKTHNSLLDDFTLYLQGEKARAKAYLQLKKYNIEEQLILDMLYDKNKKPQIGLRKTLKLVNDINFHLIVKELKKGGKNIHNLLNSEELADMFLNQRVHLSYHFKNSSAIKEVEATHKMYKRAEEDDRSKPCIGETSLALLPSTTKRFN